MKRREFLRKSCLFSSTSLATAFLARDLQPSRASAAGPVDRRRVLVFIELAGGCDGLNSLVPHGLDDYYRQRPNLAIPPAAVLKLDHAVGFHPSLEGFKRLFDAGKMALIQGVGFPDPNRSHFRSRKIWYTARLEAAAEGGFPDRNSLPQLGMQVPDPAIAAPRLPAGAESRGRAVPYPDSPLAANLKAISRIIAAGTEVRVFHTCLGGFDTHAFQVVPGNPTQGIHAGLLSTLSGAVTAFLDDLIHQGREEHAVVVIYSEFGRRLAENGTFGTDHGTANPIFILGKAVVPGLHGRHPGLSPNELTPSGDLVHAVDFRSVYAGVLPGWAGIEVGCAPDPRLSLLRI